jgi:mRNA-degrading endonuclease RelE of RelBE toxin-antitoxin system
VWEVRYLPEAEEERKILPPGERAALYNAVRKLESLGPDLPYPHTSAVKFERACKAAQARLAQGDDGNGEDAGTEDRS